MTSGLDEGAGSGPLIVAAAPIGRPDDASSRLAATLASVRIIAAEDTRRLRRLAAALGVVPKGRGVSYYDGVETARAPAPIAALADRPDLLLLADAAMP